MPTKTLYHSELVKMGPVRVTVQSDVLPSQYKGKVPYVVLLVNGEERSYNTENDACAQAFKGQKGKTFSIVAEGRDTEASITYVGESAEPAKPPTAAPQTAHRAPEPARPPQTSPPTAAARPKGSGMMRVTEIRYERKTGLPNYCSETIGIVVALEDGARPDDALFKAKAFVDKHAAKPPEPLPATDPGQVGQQQEDDVPF